jgi:uncharacterized protein RhaS with RHS repeats
VSEDPIGFAAGDANLYRYVGNSVTNAVDPQGLEPKVAAEVTAALAKGDIKYAMFLIEHGIRAGNAAKTVVPVITAILNKFPARALQCVRSADLIFKTLSKAGQNPTVIRITDRFGGRIFSYVDKAGRRVEFAKDGYHEAVLAEGIVYDALTGPAGLKFADYVVLLRVYINLVPEICNKATGTPVPLP